MELVDPVLFALTTPNCGPVIFRVCWEYMYDLEYHVLKRMVRFVEMYGYWCFSFDTCITYMFGHSESELPFSFSYILFSTLGACDEIDQVSCGAVSTKFRGIPVTGVCAREIF